MHHSAIYLCLLASLWPAFAWGEPIEGEAAVEAGRDALAGRTHYPWYDRSKDAVRPLDLAPEANADSANRQSKWKKNAQTTKKTRADRKRKRLKSRKDTNK